MRTAASVLGLIASLCFITLIQTADAETALSASCAARADTQSATTSGRTAFMSQCMQGAVEPSKPPTTTKSGSEGNAVASSNLTDKSARSTECDAEADRRGLDRGRAAFKSWCVASASPVRAIGTALESPTPAAAKPEGTTDAPGQH
jgi:hypothetical protein